MRKYKFMRTPNKVLYECGKCGRKTYIDEFQCECGGFLFSTREYAEKECQICKEKIGDFEDCVYIDKKNNIICESCREKL